MGDTPFFIQKNKDFSNNLYKNAHTLLTNV